MIVRVTDRVLVQGITGKQGTYWTERMQAYGTHVVAGVNPKKADTRHCGVPVYASASDAMRETGFDVSVLFIPPLGVKAAAQDAIEAGCARLVVLTEHVPVQDVMELLAMARANGCRRRRAQHRRPGHAGRVLRRFHAGVRGRRLPARPRGGDLP